MKIATILTALLLFVTASFAVETDDNGEVRIPLNQYDTLVTASQNPVDKPIPAPARYALGHAAVTVRVSEIDNRVFATIETSVSIRVFEKGWVAVPVLPTGTPIQTVTVSGKQVELFTTENGLSWGTKEPGVYKMKIRYRGDAQRSKHGISLPIPVPGASATTLNASLPGTGLDVAVIPSAGITLKTSSGKTDVTASIPATTGIQLSWRLPAEDTPSISRVSYHGKVVKDSVKISSTFEITVFKEETATIELLPKGVTLSNIRVDGRKSPIIISDEYFAAMVKGKGSHIVTVDFQVPVVRKNGPPNINLNILPVPVSKILMEIPGKKEVTVNPVSHVDATVRSNVTKAEVYVPLTEKVNISWAEAVPENIKAELRANASIYHTVHAEEGVLYVTAMSVYEISRGETNLLELELPDNIQINRITMPSGAISDWRVMKKKKGKPRLLSVFLDRKVKGNIRFNIYYDRSISAEEFGSKIKVPLLRAKKVQRQRGMIALLSSKELTLKPVDEQQVTRVGENQLPSYVKQAIDMTVAHTYKYGENKPKLIVQATTPERKQGKFDARVNTLISLGDVTMTGSATIEVNVKSGTIMDLQLELPSNVNFLSLTAPSLRIHKNNQDEKKQIIDVQFTQEMEGQFRIEVGYELIMADGASDVVVPTLSVAGAEVEQGRIAVEALTAVEVQASTVAQLSSLDPGELPKQLILKTTNPILLAYKYAHVDPPYKLTLKITRHKEIEVQSAMIDNASYRTLYTIDGLAVTTAEFIVRNSRKQFIRVKLPKGSTVWSAFVDGKPEKPAISESATGGEEADPNILIKIINSSSGFPVTLIYQTPVARFGSMGRVKGVLPRPDMVVTNSRWDVFLPDDIHYGKPDSNMSVKVKGTHIRPGEMEQRIAGTSGDKKERDVIEPLKINVPTSGIHFAFEKIYANQSEEDAWFSISYTSGTGGLITLLLTLAGTIMVWIAIFGIIYKGLKQANLSLLIALGIAGIIILFVGITVFGAGYLPPMIVSLGFILWGGYKLKNRISAKEPELPEFKLDD